MSGPKRLGPNTNDQRALGGPRSQTTDARDAKAYLWAGTIVHVDTETMVCSVRFASGIGERHDVSLTAPGGAGPRSWSGSLPERGSRVIIGWKKFGNRGHVPYILEYLTPGVFPARDFEPFSSLDPADLAAVREIAGDILDDPGISDTTVRLRSRKAYSGDFLASSSEGSDLILDRDFYVVNRAGNEFRLRDSDQTSVLQTINEFTSNAVGFYRRGLVKRNAFNFLPDLYPLDAEDVPAKVISPGDESNGVDANGDPLDRNPAYNTLLEFGLIREDGSKNFPDETTNPFYPYVVAPDGQRISYVTQGEHDLSYAQTSYAYTEDRRELRHISDGIMTVTEEGDGFQIDPPYPVFIEDVVGTVVGNDFHSESGRPLYKKILSMRVFDSPDQGSLSNGPIFEPIDTIQRLSVIDDLALAKLFRVQSPNSSNQYAFGVTKEGKVIAHIPKTRAGEAHEKGKSVDLNIQGLFKAIIGADENNNNMSLDLRMLGGVNLEIGRLSSGESVTLNLKGKIRRVHNGNDEGGLTLEEVYGGSTMRSTSGSEMHVVGGALAEDIGGERGIRATSIALNAGAGGFKQVSAGDYNVTVLGKTQEQYAQLAQGTYAIGRKVTLVAGVDSTTQLAGTSSHTILAGSMSTSVVTGNMGSTVGTGNMTQSVGTGNWSVTVGSGSLSLTCAAGPVSISSSLVTSIIAAASANIQAPFVKIGNIGSAFAVGGIPGPPAPMLDYLTGLPLRGCATIQIG